MVLARDARDDPARVVGRLRPVHGAAPLGGLAGELLEIGVEAGYGDGASAPRLVAAGFRVGQRAEGA
jgi:hypothetical protein